MPVRLGVSTLHKYAHNISDKKAPAVAPICLSEVEHSPLRQKHTPHTMMECLESVVFSGLHDFYRASLGAYYDDVGGEESDFHGMSTGFGLHG